MNAVAEVFTENEEFFAPTSYDMIDGLIAEYNAMKKNIEHVAEFTSSDMNGAIDYFLEGNKSDRYGASSVEQLFKLEGAMKALNAAYWSKTLARTDVLEAMPQKRRSEWHESIRDKTVPEFTEDTVRATVESLMALRHKFFAERVDGIFRNLSGEHVTNSPMGFRKRMIMACMGTMYDRWFSVNHERAGYINDLRCVIAKFMGRDQPSYNMSGKLLETLKGNFGEWVTIDGGALKIRLYMKGTAHIEVHPDMAWRLNQVLAYMHPMAIASEYRTKPKKKLKEFELIQRPLPFSVLDLLATGGVKGNEFGFSHGAKEKAGYQEALRTLIALGGVMTKDGSLEFDYNPREIIDQVINTGCVPDQQSHQYYPTPLSVAEEAIETADISAGDICLEPSAGQGGLADLMPVDTACVEISDLHCKVLEAKGHKVIQADFLKWSGGKFDKIVMNPPYSEGRWQAHIQHAATMLSPNGALVAILPASAKNKDVLPEMNCSWSRVFSNEFAGTSVSVVILKASIRQPSPLEQKPNEQKPLAPSVLLETLQREEFTQRDTL